MADFQGPCCMRLRLGACTALFVPFRGSQEGARGVFRHFVKGAQGTLRCRIYAETRAKAPPGIYPEGALRRMGDSNPRGLAPNPLSKRAP